MERQTSDASNMYMHGMSVFQLRAHPLFLIKALSIKKEIVSFKVKVTETNYILVSLFSLVRLGWIPVVHFNIDSISKHRYDKNFCNKEKKFRYRSMQRGIINEIRFLKPAISILYIQIMVYLISSNCWVFSILDFRFIL